MMKLGPGLMAPTRIAPAIVRRAAGDSVIVLPALLVSELPLLSRIICAKDDH
jgi:hypothetical protein